MEARWEGDYFGEKARETIKEAQDLLQEEEKKRQERKHKEMEARVAITAEMVRQVHAHIGLGTIRDEAELAKKKIEVTKENKKIVLEQQKKRDMRALEAERKVQEQKMSWAQRVRGSVGSNGPEGPERPRAVGSMTLDKATPILRVF